MDHSEIKAVFTNVPSHCQPVDHGVIAALKIYYHFNLIEKLIEEDANLITFSKSYHHKRCYLFSIENLGCSEADVTDSCMA